MSEKVRTPNSGKLFLPGGVIIDVQEIIKNHNISVYSSLYEELSSSKMELTAESVITVNRQTEAEFIEVYVEQGEIRVRADGGVASSTTGIPLGLGYSESWYTDSISDGNAPFITGFDFELERDSDVDIVGNIGYSDNRPKAIAYEHVDTPVYTTLTNAETFYVIPLTLQNITRFKVEYDENGRMRYMTHEQKDGRHNISGSIQQDGSIGRILSIGIRKNGTEVLSYTRVRCRETEVPYAFSLFSSSSPTNYDDYFEVVVSSLDAGDPVSIIDLQWHFDTV